MSGKEQHAYEAPDVVLKRVDEIGITAYAREQNVAYPTMQAHVRKLRDRPSTATPGSVDPLKRVKDYIDGP